MTGLALLLLALLIAALVSLFFELLPVDVTALTLLAALLVTGLVSPESAFEGFSNRAVLTVAGLLVLSHALIKTGLLEVLGFRLSRRFEARPWLGIGVLLVLVAVLSGFLNNTAVVAMTIPLTIELARRFGLNASKVLLPLSYAAIFGGTLTLVGTSTNLLVSSLVEDAGLRPLGLFEFTPLGLIFLAVGLLYVLAGARRFLPERAIVDSLTDDFEMEPFLSELEVTEGSKLTGRTLSELHIAERYEVTVVAILRGKQRLIRNLASLELAEGDLLLVNGPREGLLQLLGDLNLTLLPDVELHDEELEGGGQVVVEALVGRDARLLGKTLAEVDFPRAFGGMVLALRRQDATRRQRLAQARLRFADTLLLVIDKLQLPRLRRDGGLIVTSEVDLELRRERLWWLPAVLIPAVMVLAALEVLPLLTGVLTAVVLLLLARVLTPRESYGAIDWTVVVFIAAFIPVGEAMIRTGLADTLAGAALLPASWFPAALAPWVAVSGLYLVASALTETLSNNAAAVVLTPVALQMGAELGVDPRPFVFAVCFAASASFTTPTGYQTNMMVYGPGHYRFTDFTRFGLPLNLLFWLLASLLLPVVFPFR